MKYTYYEESTKELIETAARELCRLDKVNPDEEIEYNQGYKLNPPVKRCKIAADAIIRQMKLQQAIDSVKAQKEYFE